MTTSPLLYLGGVGVQELILLLIPLALWIWAIVSLVNSNKDSTTKLIWALVIIFIPFFGSLIYLIAGRK